MTILQCHNEHQLRLLHFSPAYPSLPASFQSSSTNSGWKSTGNSGPLFYISEIWFGLLPRGTLKSSTHQSRGFLPEAENPIYSWVSVRDWPSRVWAVFSGLDVFAGAFLSLRLKQGRLEEFPFTLVTADLPLALKRSTFRWSLLVSIPLKKNNQRGISW